MSAEEGNLWGRLSSLPLLAFLGQAGWKTRPTKEKFSSFRGSASANILK